MLVCNEEEKILLDSENAAEISIDGSSSVYTDVGVVPEHQKNELQNLIFNLEREVEQLRLKQRLVDEKRREALSKILDIKGNCKL